MPLQDYIVNNKPQKLLQLMMANPPIFSATQQLDSVLTSWNST